MFLKINDGLILVFYICENEQRTNTGVLYFKINNGLILVFYIGENKRRTNTGVLYL